MTLRPVVPDRAACIAALQEILRASADGEASTQRWVAERLGRLDGEVEEISFSPPSLQTDCDFSASGLVDPAKRIAVVGRFEAAPGGHPSLLIFAHPDAEPPRNPTGWHHEPFAGAIEHGRLYGWGVADDLAGVAAMICALETLAAESLRPSRTVIASSAPSKRGARGIVAVLSRWGADAALYLHPAESGGGLGEIKAISPGILRFRITVEGQPPPTGEPEQTPFHHMTINPIDRVWTIAAALRALDDHRARNRRHPLFERAVGRSTNLMVAHVQGGSRLALNRVPASCEVAGSISFPPDETPQDVQGQIEAAVREAAGPNGRLQQASPRVEWLEGIAGAEVPLDHPFYRTVSAAIHAVTGRTPSPYALHAASDIRHPMLRAGIPCVGIGSLAGNLVQAGCTDEWVDVEDFVRLVSVTARVIMDWCGVHAV
ncbi:MAG: M20/M25/M40 family metallo-hydrolase [Armatimonadota bacterium]|nr:M20/M25/M40 family metallo-hydrolase [Armatimonadota bacterium]